MNKERNDIDPVPDSSRPPEESQPLLGILPGVPSHPGEACCSASPAHPPHPSRSPWVAFKGESLLGHTPSATGTVPRLNTRLTAHDRWGEIKVRLGLGRNRYAVEPGLYAVGQPDQQAPVLVTANYKLSVDALRRELAHQDAWILVLDTKGVNVWCAAGKGTFDTEELIHRINVTRLPEIVTHRQLVLPQLGASGVTGREIRHRTGFRVLWGPIRAGDLPRFLEDPQNVDPSMRRISFTLMERVLLIPVEISVALKPTAWVLGIALVTALLLGLTGPGTLASAFQYLLMGAVAVAIGIFCGAVLTPILLPWLPGKAFALKGALIGLAVTAVCQMAFYPTTTATMGMALALITIVTSSFLSMNFTGATPFTSPSGVEKEMRVAIPAQAVSMVIGTFIWLKAIWSG